MEQRINTNNDNSNTCKCNYFLQPIKKSIKKIKKTVLRCCVKRYSEKKYTLLDKTEDPEIKKISQCISSLSINNKKPFNFNCIREIFSFFTLKEILTKTRLINKQLYP